MNFGKYWNFHSHWFASKSVQHSYIYIWTRDVIVNHDRFSFCFLREVIKVYVWCETLRSFFPDESQEMWGCEINANLTRTSILKKIAPASLWWIETRKQPKVTTDERKIDRPAPDLSLPPSGPSSTWSRLALYVSVVVEGVHKNQDDLNWSWNHI